MAQTDEDTFSLEEAMSAQRALRQGLDLTEERFPMPALVGMLSDEIEQWRAAGRSDADIASAITAVTARPIDPADIARFYASPDARRGRG